MALVVFGLATNNAFSQATWTNPATGVAAGSWFQPANWSTAAVPGAGQIALVANGGEAKAASGSVSVTRLEIGKDAGTGTFTDTGAAISVAVDFDIGEISGTFASGPVSVSSNGKATISDAPSVRVGVSGIGDLDIGQTSAVSG
ncbi:MAG TPA: hypothetical protein VHK01_09090, partial [Lacipirellulaceae bacterium]|nr:hypothetical protein [Lacipirellulaceae bacterium]